MVNLTVPFAATEDKSATNKVARSFDNLARKREVVLAATFDAKSIAAANKPLGAIKRSADEFEKSMAAANARVLAFGTSVAVIEGMRRSFLALIKTTAEVEKSLTQIKVVANDELRAAGISIEKVGSQIFDLAKKTGQSFDATSKSFLEFARQGLKPAQTLERTRTALELVRISGAEQEKVVGGLTAAYNAFSSSGLSFTKIAEKLVNVDNKTTTSVEGLVDVLSRASSTAKLTGTSFEELLAVTATLKDITARSESVIGNAYRSISARLIDPKVLQNLEELGIKTREFDGGPLLKTIGILTNVGEKLKEIADPSLQTEIVKSISGLYQFDQLTALISALQDVNNLQGFYQKNLKASKEDSDALNKANEAFSATLINKFNAVDVTIQQVLNSLGKIGIKNPLAGLLDSLVEVGEGFTNFIDGDSFGSDIARGFVKGFGGVLLGPTGVVTVGFIIAKIIKDFGVFAFDAAKSFLSLNKTAKDQELIQKSILTTISQMPSILNGIENTESGRLLLAQRVSAEYERQLTMAASLNNIAKGAAQSVYNKGFRITDKGLTKGRTAASGYLPNLISSEMRDVKNGVGGANPNSKIVVMPNFPFGGGKKGLMVANSSEVAMKMGDGYGILNPDMMGKRAAEGDFPSSLSLSSTAVALKSGKFAPIKKIEAALNKTISEFLDLGNGTKGLYQEIQKTLKDFKLTGNTFKEVSVAANDYARELVKNKQAAKEAYEQQIILNNQKKKEQAELFRIQKLREESVQKAGAYASSMATPAALSAIPYMGLGFMGSTSAKSSSSFGSFAPSSELLARLALLSKDSSLIYGDVGKGGSSYRGGNLDSPVDVFGVNPKNKQAFESSSIYGNVGRGNTSFGGGNLNNAVDVFGTNPVKELPQAVDKAKGSLESFAIKTFAASAIVDIVGAQFRGASETTDKLIDAFSRATLAVAGFAFLNKSGGLTAGKLFEGVGGLFSGIGGKSGGKVGGVISSFIGGISSAAKGLARFVPIVGQIGLAGFVINEFSKVFSDKSIFDRIYQAFGGLSDSAEKAKDKFNEVAAQIFDPSGQYIGRNLTERRSSLGQTRESSIRSLRAQTRGVSTSGKNPQEVEAENFRKLLLEAVGNVQTGAVRTIRTGVAGPGPIVADLKYNETVELLSSSAQEQIIQVLQEVTSGTLEELRTLASSKGIQEIGGIATSEAKREPIQKAIAKAFIEKFIKERVGKNFDLESVLEGELGRARLAGAALNFIGSDQSSSTSPLKSERGILGKVFGALGGANTIPKETLENIFRAQSELRAAVIEGTISSLEAEARLLENRASGEISNAEKTKLLAAADSIRNKIFIEQFKSAAETFKTGETLTRASGKSSQEIEAELSVLAQKYANQVNEINASIKASKNETAERNRAADALARFTSSVSAVESVLDSLSIQEASFDARIESLQARANNPALSIGAQESLQRQLNQAQIDKLQTLGSGQSAANLAAAFAQAESITDINDRKAAQNKALKAFQAENIAIEGQIKALNESTAQIGSVKSSFVALDDAILQFSRNLGESRGQNQFNLLQATDTNSIIQGLIGERVYGAAEGRSGEDLVSFIADQNALLNEQFKIRTASSQVERLELERQLELTTELLNIKNSNLSIAEKQAAIEGAINANLERRRTFESGVKDSLAAITDETNTFANEFGKTTTNAFRDGLSEAIRAATSQTDDLKSALLNVALSFANKLRDAAINNLANIVTQKFFGGGGGAIGSFFSSLFSGGVQKKAAGGIVNGGSGNKDDVPTLLMGGEYIMPKDTVRQYGKGFFDRLRDGSIGKMAQGGYFMPGTRGQGAIVGKENLLDFATQTATSGSQDVRRTLAGGAGQISLEAESGRMSLFNRMGDSPLVQATQETKDQAFQQYLQQLSSEKDYQEQLAAAKKARKDMTKQFLISIGTAVVSAGLSKLVSGFGASKETPFKGNGTFRKTSERPSFFGGSTSGSTKGSILGGLFKATAYGLANIDPTTAADQRKADAGLRGYEGFSQTVGASGRTLVPGFSVASNKFPLGTLLNINGQTFRVDDRGGMSNNVIDFYSGGDRNLYNRFANMGRINAFPIRRNAGGYGAGDTQNALLSEKEFVLNSKASQKLGDKALYALNSGVSIGNEADNSDVVERLDVLISKSNPNSGDINITVNIDKSGNETTQKEETSGDAKALTEKLRGAIVQVLREEKRIGGVLSR